MHSGTHCAPICLGMCAGPCVFVCNRSVSFGPRPNGVERTVSSRRCGDDSQGCPPSSFPATV